MTPRDALRTDPEARRRFLECVVAELSQPALGRWTQLGSLDGAIEIDLEQAGRWLDEVLAGPPVRLFQGDA